MYDSIDHFSIFILKRVYINITNYIGLQNVKKRLELLYPKKHALKIEEADNSYNVYLSLELEKV